MMQDFANMSLKELVAAFNALPRSPKAPSGIPNEWHFDIRFIQLEPTPSHVINFVQPQSQYTKIERLPLGIPFNQDGLAFFPDTTKEAAPMLAKAIVYAFVSNMGQSRTSESSDSTPLISPWKLTTDDKTVAVAVGRELKRIGVVSETLWNIGIAEPSTIAIAQNVFVDIFEQLKALAGHSGAVARLIGVPDSIKFENFQVAVPARQPGPFISSDEQKGIQLYLDYILERLNVLPSGGMEYDAKSQGEMQSKELDTVMELVEKKPERILNAEADRGDGEAALDYAIRLTVGLGCNRNRKRAHDYLIKAAYSNTASDKVKAMAHGLLISWCIKSSGMELRRRYLFAACHHANVAARLCTTALPGVSEASPSVLWFMKNVFENHADSVPELDLWYEDAVQALEARDLQWQQSQKKMIKHRMKNPNRYRCAAPGCKLGADTGSMLSHCAGRCDPDKKPSYCSKSCQKADWKNHKPYCRPGAACSVIDDGEDLRVRAAATKTASGSLQVPLTLPNGRTVLLSSSTMGAEAMKEMAKAVSEEREKALSGTR